MEGASAAVYVNDAANLKATELRLGLPGTEEEPALLPPAAQKSNKRPLSEPEKLSSNATDADAAAERVAPPVAKAQVVGWPPVRAYRKNSFQARNKTEGDIQAAAVGGLFVKVSMDGAPYLRKIDLKMYKGYRELREGLEAMFKSFSGVDATTAEFAITYEDKDGDLMLVGDVPWEMFTNSCKRLRIMKGSEMKQES